ncbi:MAG: site-2 protease family protein, partial [Pyrobaculum sp.]
EKDGRVYFGLGLGSLPIYGVHEGHVTRQELYNTDFTRLIFWLVVINYGLAVINALPIYPLDGGQLFATLLQRRLGEERGRAVINLVTWALVFMLSFNIALGLLGEQYRIFQALR